MRKLLDQRNGPQWLRIFYTSFNILLFIFRERQWRQVFRKKKKEIDLT